MLSEFLQNQATVYASGAMAGEEREHFELVLEFHEELRTLVDSLLEVSATIAKAHAVTGSAPSLGLKARILSKVEGRVQRSGSEALVVSGPDGRVAWVNPTFTNMCGYTPDELKGRSLGPILQGPNTDQAAVARIRDAVRECRPCRETLLNYHKSGTPYWVDIAITPIKDDAGELLWFIAKENELRDRVAA